MCDKELELLIDKMVEGKDSGLRRPEFKPDCESLGMVLNLSEL